MNHTDSKSAINYLYQIIKEGETRNLKLLLREIEDDYDNPCLFYVLKHCKNAKDFEVFLNDNSYLFIIENGKVSRCNDELESGQGKADKYFEEKLKTYSEPVHFLKFRKHIEAAPSDIRKFISVFYPESEFRRYLRKRPHLFIMHRNNSVHLVERESVNFFRKALEFRDGMRFMSLRGCIGKAQKPVITYINNNYPGTKFLFFLENNKDVFEIDCNRNVYLMR